MKRIGPGLQTMFSRIGPDAEKFFAGMTGLVENAMPGFEHAIEAGTRVLAQMEPDLKQFGNTASQSFDQLSQGATGGASALHDSFILIEASVAMLSWSLTTLAQDWQAVTEVAKLAGGDFTGFAIDLAKARDNSVTLGKSLHEDVGNNASFVADAVRKMSQAFDEAFGKLMGLDEANARFKEDLLGMKDALDQHSSSLGDNSLAGLHNQDVVRGLIQDAERSRQAFIDQAGGANASQAAIDQANAAYQAAIQQIIEMGVKAHLSKSELEALAGKYNIDLLYTTTYVERGTPPRTGSYSDIPTGRIGGRASGGIASGLTWVGEQGRELVRLPSGSQVYLHGQSEQMAGGTMGRSGGGGPVEVTMHFTGGTDDDLAQLVMRGVRSGRIQLFADLRGGPNGSGRVSTSG